MLGRIESLQKRAGQGGNKRGFGKMFCDERALLQCLEKIVTSRKVLLSFNHDGDRTLTE